MVAKKTTFSPKCELVVKENKYVWTCFDLTNHLEMLKHGLDKHKTYGTTLHIQTCALSQTSSSPTA